VEEEQLINATSTTIGFWLLNADDAATFLAKNGLLQGIRDASAQL
jgi:hypothetical protein